MWSSTLYSCRKFSKTGKQEQGNQISYLHKYHPTLSLRVEYEEQYQKQMPLSRTLVVCNLTGHNDSVCVGMSSSTAIYICVCTRAWDFWKKNVSILGPHSCTIKFLEQRFIRIYICLWEIRSITLVRQYASWKERKTDSFLLLSSNKWWMNKG